MKLDACVLHTHSAAFYRAVVVLQTILHYGWIPLIIYVGFTRSNPQPSLIKYVYEALSICSFAHLLSAGLLAPLHKLHLSTCCHIVRSIIRRLNANASLVPLLTRLRGFGAKRRNVSRSYCSSSVVIIPICGCTLRTQLHPVYATWKVLL